MLIGKTFEEGNLCFEVRKSFYNGIPLDEKEFDKHLIEASSLNIAGEESINFALKKKIIKKEDIKKIQNIPYIIIIT